MEDPMTVKKTDSLPPVARLIDHMTVLAERVAHAQSHHTSELDDYDPFPEGWDDPCPEYDALQQWVDSLDPRIVYVLLALYYIGRGDVRARDFSWCVRDLRKRCRTDGALRLLGKIGGPDNLFLQGLAAVLKCGIDPDHFNF
jgi:hypothetical protein